MLRKTLLAGAAAGVMAMTATAALADPIDLNNNNTVAGDAVEADNFDLADELVIGALGLDGDIEGTLDPNAGATWTTDDALLTLRITGPAVLDGPITAAILEDDGNAANCFVAASVVQTSSTEATFLLSGVNGCDGGPDAPAGSDGDLDFRLPITMTGHGTVTVSAELVTDSGGTLIDQQSHANTEVDAITSVSAFDVVFDATFGGGSGADTDDVAALTGTPPYLVFTAGGNGQIGEFMVDVDTSVHESLNQGDFVEVADVADISTTLNGEFGSFDDALCNVRIDNSTDAESDCATSISTATDTAVVPNEGSDADDVLTVVLTPDGDEQIAVSDYSATVTVDLVAGFTDFAETGNLESIEREGANIVVPIFNSATRGAASGGNYVMTIGNIANTPTGVIQVQVLNTDCDGSSMPASCSGTYTGVGDTFTLNGGAGIPAGESVTFTSAQIEAVAGDFGKGDLLFIIEADQADVTATRLLVRPDGVLEVSIGNADERLDD